MNGRSHKRRAAASTIPINSTAHFWILRLDSVAQEITLLKIDKNISVILLLLTSNPSDGLCETRGRLLSAYLIPYFLDFLQMSVG